MGSGTGTWNLVISHGCAGTAKDLTVSKTATSSFIGTYTWDIRKSVDQPSQDVSGGSAATFNYTVAVTHDGGTDSGWQVTGGSGSCGSSPTYVNTGDAFAGATCLSVNGLLSYAASMSNAGGSLWYGQVKATQGLAKDTFDAINNQVAFNC